MVMPGVWGRAKGERRAAGARVRTRNRGQGSIFGDSIQGSGCGRPGRARAPLSSWLLGSKVFTKKLTRTFAVLGCLFDTSGKWRGRKGDKLRRDTGVGGPRELWVWGCWELFPPK